MRKKKKVHKNFPVYSILDIKIPLLFKLYIFIIAGVKTTKQNIL